MTHIPGNHGLLDLYGCDEAVLKDEGRLKPPSKPLPKPHEAIVLAERFHTFWRSRRHLPASYCSPNPTSASTLGRNTASPP